MASWLKVKPPRATRKLPPPLRGGRAHGFASGLVVSGMLLQLLLVAKADALPISFGGRLVDANGAPRAGRSDIEISFFDSAENGSRLGSSPYSFKSIALEQGVFSVDIDLSDAYVAAVFRDPKTPV